MIKLKKINKCFNFEAFFQFLKNGLFWVFFSFLVVTPAILVLTKMTSTVEISVQKAIDPYLKIENLGRGGGGNAMTTTLISHFLNNIQRPQNIKKNKKLIFDIIPNPMVNILQ